MDIHITDSYKRDAASWVSFLKDFKSRASYIKAVILWKIIVVWFCECGKKQHLFDKECLWFKIK